MSHLLLCEAPAIQVDTCHGPIYLTYGVITDGPHEGEYRIVQVGAGGDVTDVHCTVKQALEWSNALMSVALQVHRIEFPPLQGVA